MKSFKRSERGLKYFGHLSDRFSGLFSRFSNRFSCQIKIFSGAISFCRHAALTKCCKYPFFFLGKPQEARDTFFDSYPLIETTPFQHFNFWEGCGDLLLIFRILPRNLLGKSASPYASLYVQLTESCISPLLHRLGCSGKTPCNTESGFSLTEGRDS